jgi:anti-anti-sigma regulatory factor
MRQAISPGLTVEQRSRDELTTWRLEGRIDEQACLGPLADQVTAPALVLDLEGITFINSAGVREWIGLLRGLQRRRVQVTLDRCPEIIVRQLNLIEVARESAMVSSVFVPYDCGLCGEEAARLLSRGELLDVRALGLFPECLCPACGEPMEAGQDPELYLSFLRQSRSP